MSIKHHILISAFLTIGIIAIIVYRTRSQEQIQKHNYNSIAEQTSTNANLIIETENVVSSGVDKTTILVKEDAKEDLIKNNLLFNSDFSDDLNGWYHDKLINIIHEDGKNIVELIGPSAGQTRIWQGILTTSGHVYRLSFNLKADQSGAFAIFRNNFRNEEQYFFVGETKGWQEFKKDFVSTMNGEYRVFLSCKNQGSFYYSDISLTDITK